MARGGVKTKGENKGGAKGGLSGKIQKRISKVIAVGEFGIGIFVKRVAAIAQLQHFAMDGSLKNRFFSENQRGKRRLK